MSEELIESSEQSGESSVSEESVSQAEPTQEAATQDEKPVQQEEKPAPFHEHPRFKELIDQNRSFKEQSERYQQELSRLQQQMESMRQQVTPKKEEPVDPFLRDLEKINPEYAKSYKSLYEQAQIAKQIQQQFQEYQQQQYAQKAYSHFDGLLASAKIEDPTDKELYKAAVEAEVYRREAKGEKLGLKDLDGIFNSFHGKYSKYLQDKERAITAKYATAKKTDQAPAPATGGAATAPVAKKFSSIDSQDTIKWLADQLRAAKRQD